MTERGKITEMSASLLRLALTSAVQITIKYRLK